MNKANVWSSRADVLNDLKEATGGNPGVSDIDDYVAVGERPPPDRWESIDEEEFQYHFGALGNGPVVNTAPDLDGISQMLQLVNEDQVISNEPTVFRNAMTDEIRISKLNPDVTEFVPSGVRQSQPQKKQETPKKSKFKSPNKLDNTNQSGSKIETDIKVSGESKKFDIDNKKGEEKPNTPSDLVNGENNDLTINEFKGKHSASNSINTEIKVSCENKICDNEMKYEKETNAPSDVLIEENSNSAINEFKVKHKPSASNSMNSVSKATVSSSDISLDKKLDLSNMKSEEIEEMKLKIKSKIIDSSGDSIKQKKEKNVAIAALLRLYATAPAVPAEKPVKLITPDYFKALPDGKPEAEKESDATDFNEPFKAFPDGKPEAEKESDVKDLTEPFKALPDGKPEAEKESDVKDLTEPFEELGARATWPTKNPVVYKDPFVEESIAKVNNWFDNEDSPKPKQQAQQQVPVQPPVAAPVPLSPVQLKDVFSFKKKNTSSLSINSPKSETSSEKKKQFTAFVPSSYASDLLQKYEKNAKSQVAPKEDWRDALERQLMEKDEKIKKKKRDEQDRTTTN